MQNKMKCDIYMLDDIYYIEAEIPGFKRENIKINVNRDNIFIDATKEDTRKYLIHETVNHLYRKFSIKNLDVNRIEAKYEDGILLIKVPKKDILEKKKIEIK